MMPTEAELEQNLKNRQTEMLGHFAEMLKPMLSLFRRIEIGRDEIVTTLLKVVDTVYGRVQ